MASLELDEPEPSPGAEPAASTTMDLEFELDETSDNEIPVEPVNEPQPATTQTAETADSIEPSSTPEAAPAAPPATEQAETETSSNGEEIHQNNQSR